MFMKQALSLCPDLLVLRYDFEQYEAVSRQLYRLCLAFSPASLVQPVSVDELYIQIQTPSGGQRCDVVAAVQFLREEIFRQTGCSASAGVCFYECIHLCDCMCALMHVYVKALRCMYNFM